MSTNKVTCRKRQESRVFLKVALLVQEVLRVERAGCLPHFVIFQHRVQQGNDDRVLRSQETWSHGTVSDVAESPERFMARTENLRNRVSSEGDVVERIARYTEWDDVQIPLDFMQDGIREGEGLPVLNIRAASRSNHTVNLLLHFLLKRMW